MHQWPARTTIGAMAARSNKRRFVRTRAQNLVAHLRVGDRTIQAPVDDISMGGMLARTSESIAIGTAVMFDLARPGLKKPLRLLGVVVDTRVGRGLGIRFDGLDRDGSDRLGDLIKDLGGMTSSLLVDKPDDSVTQPLMQASLGINFPPPGANPASAPAPLRGLTGVFAPPATIAPVAQPTSSPAPITGTHALVPTVQMQAHNVPQQQHQQQLQAHGPTDLENKLTAQARSMVMEIGRLQELVQQREKELDNARLEIERLKADTASGDAAQRIVGKLEIEKNKLEGQLAEHKTRARVDVDQAQREAEQAIGALNRVLETLRRLR